MLRKLLLAVVSVLLLTGGLASTRPERLTVSLFLHYLAGSGEPVTIREPALLAKLCPSGRRGLTSAYGTRYEYALGKFTCKGEEAYDLYDFNDKDRRDFCRDLQPRRLRHEPIEVVPYLVGKCLVGKGYGEPFEVHITK